jgi:RNA polymerase sigma factor (sigma-70 family)
MGYVLNAKANMFDSIRDKVRRLSGQLNKDLIRPRFDHSDVAQEAMLQVLRDADKQQITDTAWLKTVVSGHFCKLQRLNLAKKRSVNKEEIRELDEFAHQSVSDSVELNELTELMLDCLERLSHEARHAVTRRNYDNATFKQIAVELNTTEYGAKSIYEQGIDCLTLLMRRRRGNPK